MTFGEVKRTREKPTAEDVDNRELHKLIDIALEKQIPKKVEVIDKNYGYYSCRACGSAVTYRVHKYCCRCGQALDWGDDE